MKHCSPLLVLVLFVSCGNDQTTTPAVVQPRQEKGCSLSSFLKKHSVKFVSFTDPIAIANSGKLEREYKIITESGLEVKYVCSSTSDPCLPNKFHIGRKEYVFSELVGDTALVKSTRNSLVYFSGGTFATNSKNYMFLTFDDMALHSSTSNVLMLLFDISDVSNPVLYNLGFQYSVDASFFGDFNGDLELDFLRFNALEHTDGSLQNFNAELLSIGNAINKYEVIKNIDILKDNGEYFLRNLEVCTELIK